jgi:hypothetical protein
VFSIDFKHAELPILVGRVGFGILPANILENLMMIPLYNDIEFQAAKSRQLLPLQCLHCGKPFFRDKHSILSIINKTAKRDRAEFCSRSCNCLHKHPPIFVSCQTCNKKFKKTLSEIKRNKHHFCSYSCGARWTNSHRKGSHRSRLEIWFETQLKALYPSLIFKFNEPNIINAELDIYIPSLKLAFELNGILHYKPIFGQDKLISTQLRDGQKIISCAKMGIELDVIDVSSMKGFQLTKAQKYLDIILKFIGGHGVNRTLISTL